MTKFGVDEHATMYALMVQQALDQFGEDAKPAVLLGTRRYGERRGSRMAEAAKSLGLPLDFVSYMLLGELKMGEAGNVFDTVQAEPHVKMHVPKCGWHGSWKNRQMLEYGKYYCQEIDAAIMRGFNPDFRFGVSGTMPNGAEHCTFDWYDGNMSAAEAARLGQLKAKYGDKTKSWEFHTADVYQMMRSTFEEKWGLQGAAAADRALEAFAGRYGQDAAKEVLELAKGM